MGVEPIRRRASSASSDRGSIPTALSFLGGIWALDHALQSRSKRMLRTLGLTGPQRLALRFIGRRSGIGAGELAASLHLHPSTVTGILARLERRGLVRRAVDATDSRRVVLTLTTPGRRLDTPTPGTIEAVVERVLAGLPKRETDATRRVLGQLAAALGAADRPRGRTARRTA